MYPNPDTQTIIKIDENGVPTVTSVSLFDDLSYEYSNASGKLQKKREQKKAEKEWHKKQDAADRAAGIPKKMNVFQKADAKGKAKAEQKRLGKEQKVRDKNWQKEQDYLNKREKDAKEALDKAIKKGDSQKIIDLAAQYVQAANNSAAHDGSLGSTQKRDNAIKFAEKATSDAKWHLNQDAVDAQMREDQKHLKEAKEASDGSPEALKLVADAAKKAAESAKKAADSDGSMGSKIIASKTATAAKEAVQEYKQEAELAYEDSESSDSESSDEDTTGSDESTENTDEETSENSSEDSESTNTGGGSSDASTDENELYAHATGNSIDPKLKDLGKRIVWNKAKARKHDQEVIAISKRLNSKISPQERSSLIAKRAALKAQANEAKLRHQHLMESAQGIDPSKLAAAINHGNKEFTNALKGITKVDADLPSEISTNKIVIDSADKKSNFDGYNALDKIGEDDTNTYELKSNMSGNTKSNLTGIVIGVAVAALVIYAIKKFDLLKKIA